MAPMWPVAGFNIKTNSQASKKRSGFGSTQLCFFIYKLGKPGPSPSTKCRPVSPPPPLPSGHRLLSNGASKNSAHSEPRWHWWGPTRHRLGG